MSIELNILLVTGFIVLQYYLFIFSRLNFVRGFRSLPEFLPPASVVICAKNEAKNLALNLKVVLIQQYPQFEVIVVNDQSTDDTPDVLVEYYMRNKNLKIVNIPVGESKAYAGKKFALMKGIEAASFETIVVTDADCRPASFLWLSKLVGTYLAETKIVLGYSPFEKGEGFLNKLIRYENFVTAIQYMGFANSGMPYMGVGRNMSYKKGLFGRFNSFEKNKALLTGDDDLFINAAAQGGNTELCIDKDAFTYTQPALNFKEWLNQKKRHLRSGFRYKLQHQLLLFLFAASNFLFYAAFIMCLAKTNNPKFVLAVFFGLVFSKLVLTFRVYNKLAAADLRWISPLLDIVHSGYLLMIFFLLLLKPKDTWKR